jgi:hypothetical protein
MTISMIDRSHMIESEGLEVRNYRPFLAVLLFHTT